MRRERSCTMIRSLLFERPWALLAVMTALQFLLICLWSARRTPATARTVQAGFAAIPLLLAVSHLVVTPKEQIVARLRELAHAVDRGDVDRIASSLTADFQAGGMDRSAFTERLHQRLSRYRVDDPRLRNFSVSLPGAGEGVAQFDASARVRSPDAIADRVLSRWRVTLRRQAERWMVVRIEALPAPFSPIRDLRHLGP